MKIDGSQLADDLLQRMQQAHEAPGVESADAGDQQASFRVGDVGRSEAASPVEEVEPLDAKLRTTAEKALRGEFESGADVRSEVVDQILRDRWESKLGKARTAKMIRSLKPTLVEDPEFTRQVDQMLIMAARQLGSNK